MSQTLLLDVISWDLVADASGNIAVASEPYSLSQDAASACRLFQGELLYDVGPGVPYWAKILGRTPPLSLLKSYYVQAAMRVPGVVKARVFFTALVERALGGQVQVEDAAGEASAAGF